jgi:two-component system sensor histidine kinase YesM
MLSKVVEMYHDSSIQYTLFVSFALMVLVSIITTGVTMYARFSEQLENNKHHESQLLVEQTSQSLSLLFSNMIRLSDTLCYQVIKNNDVTSSSVKEQMQLLYNANNSSIKNIALFSSDGRLLSTAPPAMLKDYTDVTKGEWFIRALSRPEDVHFSSPAVQRIFMDKDNQYSWVISLSCASEITQDKNVQQGVVLIDIRYSAISEIFKGITLANDGYVYLIDSDGNVLYHPHHQLLESGYTVSCEEDLSKYHDGEYSLRIDGKKSSIIIRSAGYTGWKIIGVIPQKGLMLDNARNIQYLMIIITAFFSLSLFAIAVISNRLTVPIKKLDSSVRYMEQNLSNAQIYVGGSQEIKHLGKSIQQMVETQRGLTDEIVQQQVQKQKNELNALQSQINPHFLYNTLDIMVWTIEKGHKEDTLRIVSALGRFFRISLSKGKNIIPVRDELEHVRSYLMIQELRYKSKFTYSIQAQEETLGLSTIKLVLQPIVENAIYHSMDYMTDGEGKIEIRAYIENGDLYMSVEDNGLGMTRDVIDRLLNEGSVSSKGSGIGLKNVHERIMLYFGDEYGVVIESEPDEGTCIRLHLPAVPYNEKGENK